MEEIFGYAFVKDQTKPGELTVNLGGRGNAPYWIIELGPIVDNQYDYSIVTDPYRTTLFVLTRNVSRFYEEYETDVLSHLQKYKFTSFRNRPIKTDQENCVSLIQ